MAVTKATTTEDLGGKPDEKPAAEPKMTKLKNPFTGAVTEVPETIVEQLKESGYK